jgi:hypothetical protein
VAPALRNVFACLVHESPECVLDLVRNLRCLDPTSPILLFNGGSDPSLLDHGLGLERYDVRIHPRPQRLKWGRLHDFALESMRYALEQFQFDALTIVDSDQLATRAEYSRYVGTFLETRPHVGMLVNSPGLQVPGGHVGPATAAFRERPLWQPLLQRFPTGAGSFVHWSFWPGTVFTREAARALTELVATDRQLQDILARTKIWATEEVILPTLVALLGFEIARSPCSYDFVQYRARYASQQIDEALSRHDVYWIHPIPRRYADPLRARVRAAWRGYGAAAAEKHPAPPARPLVSCIMPTHDRRAFIPRAVQQFLSQDYPRRELIVIDDGHDIVADLIPPDPRIRYVRLERRVPLGSKRNTACQLSRGELIVHWDDDDWMAPWRIAYQARAMREHPDAAICGLARVLFYDPTRHQAFEYAPEPTAPRWVAGGTMCYRRTWWEAHRFADVDRGEDTRFVRAVPSERILPLPDQRFYVATMHVGSMTAKRIRPPRWQPREVEDVERLMAQPAEPLPAAGAV